ncbi:S41 family peptidase [Anaerosphaera multitolerans]|uniref:S41 family peptidase n=1 Tax=Anaerosphaera multitolerans TaxID=2487351 RepID=A0A437S876_9FIRM|nr:S41 family peptidase [Anaerosphaera multitolerans]RVU55128.1 S41 family peptidase [Anaerosphaera multitolerans]
MKDRKKISLILAVALIVITNIVTFNVAIIGHSAVSENKYVKLRFLEEFVKENYLYPVTDEDLEAGELKGVIAGLDDPYSMYMTKDEFQEATEDITGRFHGIGVYISAGEDGLITVISPVKGSPADKAGIEAGDKIISIDGKDYTADKINDAVNSMKGEEGTEVDIKLLRPSNNKVFDVTIKREEIKDPTIISDKIGDLGYIGITQFKNETGADFKNALGELEAQNVKGLIVDLRGNGGGNVETAVEVADALLPEGVIVYAKNKDGDIVFDYNSDSNQTELPIVVLINEYSASASEILAGAIQDHGRGTIVGMNSFGKGIGQSQKQFANGDGIRLTTFEYFLPKGENIHNIGIKPDVEVELPDDIEGIGIEYSEVDLQLQKAIEILSNRE